MNYLNEMEYLSQEMKIQKNIMMQSDKDLLEEKQIWEKERAMLLKKIKELEQKNKKYEIQLDKTQAILWKERNYFLKERETILKLIEKLSI
jgi:hypothetical protein